MGHPSLPDDRRDRDHDRRASIEFDLPHFLTAMREELNKKIDDGFKAQAARSDTIAADLRTHEASDIVFQGHVTSQLVGLGDLKKTAQWMTRTAIGALILYAVKVVFLSHN